MKKLFSALALALAAFSHISAATVVVQTSQELTDAINEAAANKHGSTKIIVEGTIQGNFTVPATLHAISIVGKKGSEPTLDGAGSGTVLTVELGASVAVKHLTITNGYNLQEHNGGAIMNLGTMRLKKCAITNSSSSSNNQYATLNGGGIYNNNIMSIEACIISDNVADRGGGIYNDGKMTITETIITENSLSTTPMYCYGGGIFSDGYLTVSKSIITDNTASNGYAAGVYTGGEMSISESVIANNAAYFNCGGIENDVFLTIYKCDIYGNFAETGVGAGVYNDYGDMVITNSTIHDNIAQEGDGAGVQNSWNMLIKNSSITNNTAENGNGGGISNTWHLVIEKCTIKENSAPQGDGGGIYNDGDGNEGQIDPTRFITIKSSKIHKNVAEFGGGIANEGGALLELCNTEVTKNIATQALGGGGIYNPSPSQFVLKDSKVIKNAPDNISPLP